MICPGAPFLLLLCQFHLPWSQSQPHSCPTSGWTLPNCNSSYFNVLDGVWLLLCPVGGHSTCSCSLPCSGRCFPVGRGTACLLPGKVLLSSDLENIFPSPSSRMVATEKREWYELSDHWLRASSESLRHMPILAVLWKVVWKRKVWNFVLRSSYTTTCSPVTLLSCVCLLFPTHYFDNSIVKQIHPVAIWLMHFDIGGSTFYSSLCYAWYTVNWGRVVWRMNWMTWMNWKTCMSKFTVEYPSSLHKVHHLLSEGGRRK